MSSSRAASSRIRPRRCRPAPARLPSASASASLREAHAPTRMCSPDMRASLCRSVRTNHKATKTQVHKTRTGFVKLRVTGILWLLYPTRFQTWTASSTRPRHDSRLVQRGQLAVLHQHLARSDGVRHDRGVHAEQDVPRQVARASAASAAGSPRRPGRQTRPARSRRPAAGRRASPGSHCWGRPSAAPRRPASYAGRACCACAPGSAAFISSTMKFEKPSLPSATGMPRASMPVTSGRPTALFMFERGWCVTCVPVSRRMSFSNASRCTQCTAIDLGPRMPNLCSRSTTRRLYLRRLSSWSAVSSATWMWKPVSSPSAAARRLLQRLVGEGQRGMQAERAGQLRVAAPPGSA